MLIKVKNLTKKFGPFTAVENISFNLAKGEVLGFLGPNGAGKTTTMRMITGFLPPTSGQIMISKHNIQEFPILTKKKIGYVPEGAPLYGEMTVYNFLKFIFNLRKSDTFNDGSSIDLSIDRLGLEKVLYQQIDTLSKGYKRRVGLAQAILHDPEILILDEPTDGLDPNQKHEVRKLITEMSSNKAIIISTHILEEVDAVCTRAMIISNGKMLVDKSPRDLLKMNKKKNSYDLICDSVIHQTDADRYDNLIKHFKKVCFLSMGGCSNVNRNLQENTYICFLKIYRGRRRRRKNSLSRPGPSPIVPRTKYT